MIIITEENARSLVGADEAFGAVEATFAAMAKGEARNFPVVREALGYADALYGFKSGFDVPGKALGLKAGGYWPGNADKGLTNHQSSVFLFDPDTGRATAVVSGNYLTAARTAAACAVSVHYLSRKDSRVLGIIGAGHQAPFQLRAAAAQRDFDKVLSWNITPNGQDRLKAVADELGLAFAAVDRDELTSQADVIVTITSCFEPLITADQIKPGTHISCMGTDTVGKQEIDPNIIANAAVFTDEPAQSAHLGEAQHAVKQGLIAEDSITPVGAVIAGMHGGRQSADEITVFDGTGVGLQDLAVASRAVARAQEQGSAIEVDLG